MTSYSISIRCPKCGNEGEANMDADSVSCAFCNNQVATWDEENNEYKWSKSHSTEEESWDGY